MYSIIQVRTNVEKLLKDQIAASMKELEMNVSDLISKITRSIQRDLTVLLKAHVPFLNNGNMGHQFFETNFDIRGTQDAVDLLDNLA
jgi:hypothetical protein